MVLFGEVVIKCLSMTPLKISSSAISVEALTNPPCEQKSTTVQQRTASIYNDAKLIFHAIGPKFHSPELEGIDPPKSLEVMEITLGQFIEQNPDLTQEMRDRISKMQKSLSSAKANYLTCIGLVNLSGEPSTVSEVALKLSQDVKSLADNPSNPSILFVGGHYIHPKGGSLGGHTASYEVIRQDNGKLSFLINNTAKITAKIEEYHEINGNRTRQLVYTDLEIADLDVNFWRNVIQTNFMNPVRWAVLMDAFYAYVDEKLLKGSNKTMGRSFKSQEVGVCAWKSISVWVHGKISPGNFSENRDSSNELIHVRFKKFMFENMLANFDPGESFKAMIRNRGGVFKIIQFSLDVFNNFFGRFFEINHDLWFSVRNEHAAVFLQAELERKTQKMDAKISANT